MREEIIKKLAHEAGLIDWYNSPCMDWLPFFSACKKFAALVENRCIEDEKKTCEAQNTQKPNANNQTFIRMAQLATTPKRAGRLPLHPNTIWKQVREGTFPAPVKIGANSTAWRLSDIEAWESMCAGGEK